ncbi:RES domain-containing protein [Cohaesibacter marisflavi]|uniref:RES domain-containing protein n=1 Tax=Cohaesibacter marisflavi TaxID=655353 RepID=UPI000B7D5DD8|nr:RES domain-containing protein [Cohaesibacter marisflavi]
MAKDTDLWTNKQVFNTCLDLADKAREAQAEIIRYQSVRDPRAGANLQVLDPAAFASPEPIAHQTGHIHIRPDVAQAICALLALSLEFRKSDFADDRVK